MLGKISRYSFLFLFVGLLGGCSLHESMHQKVYDKIFHGEFMSGQIVRVEGEQAVVCIGSKDGAKTGMVFQAYEVKYEGAIAEGSDNYELHSVGTIEIESIIDGHFARAKILNGNVKPTNIVELSENELETETE